MQLEQADWEHVYAIANARTEAVVSLTQRICAVPAPTGDERQRAGFVARLLRERGYTPEIDALGNVYTRRGVQGHGPLTMLLAHIDTVFPGDTPLRIERDGDIVRGPGIGDNSLSVAAMITLLDILDELGWQGATDLLAVADVGEEGLGNLCGARAAIQRYRNELGAVVVIDGRIGSIVTVAVGSKRWRVVVRGPGGHSFGAFRTPSAIHGLGKIIAALADLEVPLAPKTTFNVGIIEGGTSINTIAASASALLDLRSTDVAALEQLAQQARAVIMRSAGPGLSVEIETLGERPAGQRSQNDPLVVLAARALKWVGLTPKYIASSTDANIPISLDIPAICIGVSEGDNAHTLDEYINVQPIGKGLAQLLRVCIEASELIKI